MLKKIICLVLSFLLLFLADINAQPDFYIKNQRHYKYIGGNILDSLKINNPDFRISDFELRVTIWNFASGIHKLFIINNLKNKSWSAKSYEYYYYNDSHYNFKNLRIEQIELKQTWDSVFKSIVAKDYVNLPSQKEVEKTIAAKAATAEKNQLVIADGISYSFEFLTKKKKRRFSVGNPETYFEFHKAQLQDTTYYEKYLDLIQLLKSVLDFRTHLIAKEG